MVFQPVTGTVELVFKLVGENQLSGSEAQFYFTFTRVGTVLSADVEAIKDAGVAWVTSDFADVLNTNWQVIQVTATDLSVVNGFSASDNIAVEGLRSGEPLAANVAMLIQLSGASGTLPKNGHRFLPVGDEGVITGNLWATAFQDAVELAVNALIADVIAAVAAYDHSLVSRYLTTNDDVRQAREALRAAIAATRRASGVTNLVDSVTSRRLVSTQRDRRPASAV